MEQTLVFKYPEGKKKIYPAHRFVSHLEFDEGEEAEAFMCQFLAEYADKNGCPASWTLHIARQMLKLICSPSDVIKQLDEAQTNLT